MVVKTWVEAYSPICGNRRLLEGNILANAIILETIARFVKTGDKLLEIGSGTGVLCSPLVLAGVKVTSVDNDPGVLKMALVNSAVLGVDIEYQEADAFHLPFSDREFKVSFSLGLLEHFSDQDIGRLVTEHQRVADVVVVGFPIAGHYGEDLGNERYLTMEKWEELLKPMGHVKAILTVLIRVPFLSSEGLRRELDDENSFS